MPSIRSTFVIVCHENVVPYKTQMSLNSVFTNPVAVVEGNNTHTNGGTSLTFDSVGGIGNIAQNNLNGTRVFPSFTSLNLS
jgi:hypothetical protein